MLIAPTYETASDMRGFGANELSQLRDFGGLARN